MSTLREMIAETDAQISKGKTMPNIVDVTNEQIADKLWSESCQELREFEPRLNAMLARHQRAIDEGAKFGRENRLRMGPVLERAFQEWQVKQQVEKERGSGSR